MPTLRSQSEGAHGEDGSPMHLATVRGSTVGLAVRSTALTITTTPIAPRENILAARSATTSWPIPMAANPAATTRSGLHKPLLCLSADPTHWIDDVLLLMPLDYEDAGLYVTRLLILETAAKGSSKISPG